MHERQGDILRGYFHRRLAASLNHDLTMARTRAGEHRAAATESSVDPDAGPRSVARLLAIIDALSGKPDGLSLAELSAHLASPKSSLLNLLRPLVSESFLLHDGHIYRLGPALFRLASGVLHAWYLPRVMRPHLVQLARQTGESVLLAVMDPERGLMTYMDIVHGPHPVRYQLPVGTVRPLYANTAGRVLIAYADPAWRQNYLASVEFTHRTATPITRTSLKKEVEQIRTQALGWSVDVYMVGLSGMAAPLFDADGRCVAALVVAGPTDRFRSDLERLKKAVRACAANASAALAKLG